MEIWCGLGNPGAKYHGNRHNIGFLVLDAIAEDHNFPAWKTQFKGLTTTGLINGCKVLLLKPSTFMNESAVKYGSKRAADWRGIMDCALSISSAAGRISTAFALVSVTQDKKTASPAMSCPTSRNRNMISATI